MKSTPKRNRPMLKDKRLLTKRKILKRLVERSIKYFSKRSYPRTEGKSSPSRIRPIHCRKPHASRVCEAGTGSPSIHSWEDVTQVYCFVACKTEGFTIFILSLRACFNDCCFLFKSISYSFQTKISTKVYLTV